MRPASIAFVGPAARLCDVAAGPGDLRLGLRDGQLPLPLRRLLRRTRPALRCYYDAEWVRLRWRHPYHRWRGGPPDGPLRRRDWDAQSKIRHITDMALVAGNEALVLGCYEGGFHAVLDAAEPRARSPTATPSSRRSRSQAPRRRDLRAVAARRSRRRDLVLRGR